MEVSLIPQIFETGGFQDIAWKDIMTSVPSQIFAVERKCDHTYVGNYMLNHMDAIAWRLVLMFLQIIKTMELKQKSCAC